MIWLVCPSMFHDWIAVAGLIGGGCDLGGPLCDPGSSELCLGQ